jgi:hypothetical protein
VCCFSSGAHVPWNGSIIVSFRHHYSQACAIDGASIYTVGRVQHRVLSWLSASAMGVTSSVCLVSIQQQWIQHASASTDATTLHPTPRLLLPSSNLAAPIAAAALPHHAAPRAAPPAAPPLPQWVAGQAGTQSCALPALVRGGTERRVRPRGDEVNSRSTLRLVTSRPRAGCPAPLENVADLHPFHAASTSLPSRPRRRCAWTLCPRAEARRSSCWRWPRGARQSR